MGKKRLFKNSRQNIKARDCNETKIVGRTHTGINTYSQHRKKERSQQKEKHKRNYLNGTRVH